MNDRTNALVAAVYGATHTIRAIGRASVALLGLECPCGASLARASEEALALELCDACYDEAGEENEHSDGYHKDKPSPTCPSCKPRRENG